MQETREKDSRESDIVFTQRFGQNANRLTRTQIGRDKAVLAEADVTQRTVAERAHRRPHPARPFTGLAGDSPHKLRMAVLRRFHRAESFRDAQGNDRAICFDAHMTAHEQRVIAQAGGTKTFQRIA